VISVEKSPTNSVDEHGETVGVHRFAVLSPPAVFLAIGAAHMVSLDAAERLCSSHTIERATVTVPSVLHRAVPARIRGFVAGRHCAAMALAAVGHDVGSVAEALPIGALGAPQWPARFIGSISHSHALAAAVVARRAQWHGLGIDCERLMTDEAADGVVERILPEASEVRLAHGARNRMSWAEFVTAVFSAKESVYKCLSPVCGTFFGFEDCHLIAIDPVAGVMRLRLVRSPGPGVPPDLELHAGFELGSGHVFTAVGWLPTP